MCGRIFIRTNLESMMTAFAFADRKGALGLSNQFPRYNGAPSLDYPIIIRDMVREPDTMGPVFVSDRWGLTPGWMKPSGRPPPINARCEGIATNGMFKSAYRMRRCLVPIDGFFEWQDIFGTGKNKQPYAIAMKSGAPFALAGIWEIPRSGRHQNPHLRHHYLPGERDDGGDPRLNAGHSPPGRLSALAVTSNV
jgi:putative SOS response-associated peptidase YedK